MTTIDLTQLTNDAVAKAIEDGVLKAAIDKGVTTAIKDIVDRATGYGSPFRKMLEASITSMLEIDPSRLGLPTYNAVVLEIVKAKLNDVLDEQLRDQFSEEMDRLLVKAPTEIAISKLVEDFKRWAIEDCLTSGNYCTIHIKCTGYGSTWVRLDPRGDRGEYQCRFSFLISTDGAVHSFTDNSHDMKAAILSKSMSGFPRDLFRIMAVGTKIVFDTMDVSERLVSLGDDEDGED